MGCCLSSNKHPSSSKSHHHSSTSSRSAPPPVADVETVKEVLSETPNLKIENDLKTNSSRIASFKFRPEDLNISEIGSTISENIENISATTFEDDNDVYRRKVTERSPIKYTNRSQVTGERKSPVRGKEQSPGRVKVVHERNGREIGFGSTGRSSGNVSAARSRSPAKRTVPGGGGGSVNDVGRSFSSRRTGKSPGRVGSDMNERVRKPGFRSGRGKEQSKGESLENPMVSLECFIFL